ncbi:Retrovirus-related Pol polyprotein from transposon, partial [Nosema granulosis]
HYLLGKEFTLKTDHKSLTYLWETKNPTSRLLRWAMKLQEFKFKIEYIKGEDNASDGFSRISAIRRQNPCNRAELTEEETGNILQEYHMKLGHGTPSNMKAAISARYRWKSMYTDIDKFYEDCLICKKAGRQTINTKNKVIETSRANELWEIDLMGRLSDRGKNVFVVVCIDHFTK